MKRDQCIKETQGQRLTRLHHDLVSWAEAVGMDADDLMTVCGMTVSVILSQKSQRSVDGFVSTLVRSRKTLMGED